MDPMLTRLKTLQPEVDYQALMAQMTPQSHPRRKLKELQRKGMLIRVKKGFYVLSPEVIGRSFSHEVMANLLYGPSYVSLESALSIHGLIPERVETWTSVTTQKNKSFNTPIGHFFYSHLHPSLYPLAVTFGDTADQRHFLLATPEKALLDIFALKFKSADRPTLNDVRLALEEDLRVSLKKLRKSVSRESVNALIPAYRNRPWCRLFLDLLKEES